MYNCDQLVNSFNFVSGIGMKDFEMEQLYIYLHSMLISRMKRQWEGAGRAKAYRQCV